ncbi:hypothetical protein V5N11_012597 [Cardamine amara subsp. amara]|uniref:Uncharacterized protein n=1 Tax=Cardamine amara subsp. amara TaxID=228776 RepID=A0ABD1BHD4_CARAN
MTNYYPFLMYLAEGETLEPDKKIFEEGLVRVLDPFGSNHLRLNCWYDDTIHAWGWENFLRLAELQKAYLDKEDSWNVEVEFKVVSVTKYSPII